MIKQYIKRKRAKKTQKVGLLLGFRDSSTGKVKVGWSLTNTKVGDKFDPIVGNSIATARALLPSSLYALCLEGEIPVSIQKDMLRFLDRCDRYFKDLT